MEKSTFSLLYSIGEEDIYLFETHGNLNKEQIFFDKEFRDNIDILINFGLVNSLGNDKYSLSETGIEAVKYKSWKDYLYHKKKKENKRPVWEYFVGGSGVLGVVFTIVLGVINLNLSNKQLDTTIEKEQYKFELDSIKQQMSIQIELHKQFVDSIEQTKNSKDSL